MEQEGSCPITLKQFFLCFRSLGDFQVGALYDSIEDHNNTTRAFAMIILVSLIFFCTITMINLCVAVIISDLKDLQSETFTQNLINMAHASITAESVVPDFFLRGLMTENKITLCLHDLCPEAICKKEQVPDNFNQIVTDIKKKIAEGCITVKKEEEKKKNSEKENNNSIDIVKESF